MNLVNQNRWQSDLTAGLVVFFVALPLCLGIALASNAPIVSGILSGIVGGIVIGFLSGSHTSVSGPAAGLAAIVASQIIILGSFRAFLVAVIIAGILQVVMGLLRVGFIAEFFPSSVIKGLLAAIGLLMILKQLPHLFGWDKDYEGDMAFMQLDHENTFSELFSMVNNLHPAALLIGLLSLSIIIWWSKSSLKTSKLPSSLVVVALGATMVYLFGSLGGMWLIEPEHRVLVPTIASLDDFMSLFIWPDFSALSNPKVYASGITLSLVASLETLLNLEAIDKLDREQRKSPANRELIAQGIGNILLGFIGGLPITSVVVRGSVNIQAGAKTKNSSIFHGFLLMICVLALPTLLNLIPLSCLAAVLIVSGMKLLSPKVIKQTYAEGLTQFVPFVITVTAIMFTDLLVGVLIGLATSIFFILHSNYKRSIRITKEKHIDGEILRLELADQVSFLNRASLSKALLAIPKKKRIVIDASNSDYIDSDVIDMIMDFKDNQAPAKDILVSMVGFKANYELEDEILYQDHTTDKVRDRLSPKDILRIIKEGNKRMVEGRRLQRNLHRQIKGTSAGQFPLAVSLSCIDSRAPVELVFDLGIGDIFSIRMAGNVISERVLGSLEFACVVAGAKLILIMGHTRCGAISAAADLSKSGQTAKDAFGCKHLDRIVSDIKDVIVENDLKNIPEKGDSERQAYEKQLTVANIKQSMKFIVEQSQTISKLLAEGKVDMVGCIYDVTSGTTEFLPKDQTFRFDHLLETKKDTLGDAPMA